MTARINDPDAPRPMAAGHVIVVIALALLGGAVLNAQALTEAAARQPFGWKRTAAVVAVTPFRGLAGVLGLDRAHEALADAAASAVGQPEAPPSEPEQPEAANAPVREPEGAAQAPAPGPEPTGTPEATEDAHRAPTRRDPLRVWVGGDSLSSEFGPALSDRLARTRRAEAEVEYRFSTGLARPDFFDWPARLAEVAGEYDPDVYVVVFGANDAQNLEVAGQVLTYASDEWVEEYSGRVSTVMDSLSDEATVLWVGQPVMRAPDFDEKMQFLNTIYRREARARDDVTFIDTWEVFSDDGDFAAYLTDSAGQRALVRQQDGIHYTRAGGELLTDVVFEMLADEWGLSEPEAD